MKQVLAAALLAGLSLIPAAGVAARSDPSQWRADATKERITFAFLPLTARWTNRPTFQQVMTFAAHRPRSRH
jgi:hypothetical protein